MLAFSLSSCLSLVHLLLPSLTTKDKKDDKIKGGNKNLDRPEDFKDREREREREREKERERERVQLNSGEASVRTEEL